MATKGLTLFRLEFETDPGASGFKEANYIALILESVARSIKAGNMDPDDHGDIEGMDGQIIGEYCIEEE